MLIQRQIFSPQEETEYLFLMQDTPVIGLTEYTMLFRRGGVVYETQGID